MGTVTLTHDCDINRLDSPWDVPGAGVFKDAYMTEDSPNNAYGDDNIECFAHVLVTEKDDPHWEALHYYDLNHFLPAGAIITAAVWWIYVTYTDMQVGQNIRVYRTRADWTELGATWNKYDGVNNWGINHDRDAGVIANLGQITSTGWKSFSIIDLVDDAWDNRNGILSMNVTRRDGSMGDDGGINYRARKLNPGSLTYCHKLRITYTLADKTYQVLIR